MGSKWKDREREGEGRHRERDTEREAKRERKRESERERVTPQSIVSKTQLTKQDAYQQHGATYAVCLS